MSRGTITMVEITLKPIGEAIKDFLDKNKKSYSNFIKEAKISKSYLSEIITKNLIPSEEKLKKISSVMGVEPFFFREYRKMKLNQYIDKNPSILEFKNEGELIKKINRLNICDAQKKQGTLDDLVIALIEQSKYPKVLTELEVKEIRLKLS